MDKDIQKKVIDVTGVELTPGEPSLNGLEPIRFISANIGIYFGKSSRNIAYYFKLLPRLS